MKSITSKFLAALAGILILIQFFGPDTSAPAADPSKDFLNNTQPPQEVATIIKSACYDCHSYETKYPWYSRIEPVSWWLQDHIEEGREEFNMSLWTDYSPGRADHKLEEAAELVNEEEMPLPSYTWAHSEARLTTGQRKALTRWFNSLRSEIPPDEDHDDDH